jgi:hypothetical protein
VLSAAHCPPQSLSPTPTPGSVTTFPAAAPFPVASSSPCAPGPIFSSSVAAGSSLRAGRSKAQRWADYDPLSPARRLRIDDPIGAGGTTTAKTFCAAVLSQPVARARPAASTNIASERPLPIVRLKNYPDSHRQPRATPPSDAEGRIKVETRWSRRRRRLAERPRPPFPRRPVPLDLRGRCFNCLAVSHRAAECRRPSCCLRCRRPGHRAAGCPGAVQKHDVIKASSGGRAVRERLGLQPLVDQRLDVAKAPSVGRAVWERLGRQPVEASQPFSKQRLVWRKVAPPWIKVDKLLLRMGLDSRCIVARRVVIVPGGEGPDLGALLACHQWMIFALLGYPPISRPW